MFLIEYININIKKLYNYKINDVLMISEFVSIVYILMDE